MYTVRFFGGRGGEAFLIVRLSLSVKRLHYNLFIFILQFVWVGQVFSIRRLCQNTVYICSVTCFHIHKLTIITLITHSFTENESYSTEKQNLSPQSLKQTIYMCLSSLPVLTNCSYPHIRSVCMTTLSALLKVAVKSSSHAPLECIMIRAYWPHLLSWGLDRLLGGDRQSTCDNRSRQGVWGALGLSLHQRVPDMPFHPDTDRQAFPSDTAACQAHRAPATQVDGWINGWEDGWIN